MPFLIDHTKLKSNPPESMPLNEVEAELAWLLDMDISLEEIGDERYHALVTKLRDRRITALRLSITNKSYSQED